MTSGEEFVMGLSLPTDTQHLRLETRQYELFNRPLGQGIVRRRLYLGAVVFLFWILLLLLFGVNPLSRFGPALYIVPPFGIVYLGTRVGDDGRMAMMGWYDAVLARMPGRRVVIRNPLLGNADGRSTRLRITPQMTELHPDSADEALTPLIGRRARRLAKRGG